MKTGLVLEGGASRTYFSVGVMDALLDAKLHFNIVAGSSAGIANAISYASNQRGRSLEIGLYYLRDKRYMGFRHYFNPKNKSYYNIDFVFDEIPNKELPFDYDAFSAYDGECYAAVTNMNTGKCEYLKLDSADKTWKAIVATCSLPLMFPPIKLAGGIYMDGGIADPAPFEFVLNNGCDKALVVITRERSYMKKNSTATHIAASFLKKYPEFAELLRNRKEIYNGSRHRLYELEKQGKVYVIAPENTKGWHKTESNPEKIQSMYDEGFNYTVKHIQEIKNFMQIN